MKKTILLLFIIIFCKSTFGDEYDDIYSLILKGENSKFGRSIYDNPKPYKIKYCKLTNSNKTFTVFKHQSCNFWSNEEVGNNIKHKRGKKISRKEYIKANPDFSEENNIICIRKKETYLLGDSDIFFLTHTKSNKVYLNSHGSIIHYDQNKISIEDVKEKGKWRHQGESIKEGGNNTFSYTFRFYKWFSKDVPMSYPGSRNHPARIELNHLNHAYENVKCFANDEYWLAMFPMLKKENVVTKSDDEEKRIAEAKKKEEEARKAKEDEEKRLAEEEKLTIEPFDKPEF